jgi:hypothetical protein
MFGRQSARTGEERRPFRTVPNCGYSARDVTSTGFYTTLSMVYNENNFLHFWGCHGGVYHTSILKKEATCFPEQSVFAYNNIGCQNPENRKIYPWRWMQHALLKCQHPPRRLHGVTTIYFNPENGSSFFLRQYPCTKLYSVTTHTDTHFKHEYGAITFLI